VAADIAANRHGLVATIVDLLDHKMPNDDEEEESSWTLKVRASEASVTGASRSGTPTTDADN
jgi:hypothetical protein